MIISFSPQRRNDSLTVSKSGDILTINGDEYNFTSLPDGSTFEDVPCEWILGSVERVANTINLTLILPTGPNASATMAFPDSITVTANGSISLPGNA